ncbi:MAG: glycine cleavage system protein H [Pirellulales bacterium]|nr:glycine cleavage system protein H [Pirellulales bacterium]
MSANELVFMMGKFEARFPTDRLYAKNHMWAQPDTDQPETYRFGFSAYAVRLLQDIYFLDWIRDAGEALQERQQVGGIESSKAESDLYAPFTGTLTEFNPALLSDPSAINIDMYGAGWLFKMAGTGTSLLNPQQYLEHLQDAWKVAERTLKGQFND